MKKTLSSLPLLALIATLLPSLASAAYTQTQLDALYQKGDIPFRDVAPDSEFLPHITQLKTLKLTSGTGNGAFEPDRCVSKAEVVKFALSAAAVPVTSATTSAFADVTTQWQKDNVETARAKGFLPQTDSAFHPNDCASRIFSLLVILNAAQVTVPPATTSAFADVSYAPYIAAVEYGKSKGIISGRSATAFAPFDTTLRKEMAKILMNTYTIVLHPDTSAGRLPDLDTAVRIQTILDNFTTVLSSNAVPSEATPVVTRFAFVNPEFVYVDYTEGTAKKRLLLDITKPDTNFRIAVLAAFTANGSGVMVVSVGSDTKKDLATTVYMKEGTAWLKQAVVDATTQLFANSAFDYTLTVPKSWFFWNRGAVGSDLSLVQFAKAAVTDSNWILQVRIVSTNLADTLAANSAVFTSEAALKGGKLRTYGDGTVKAFIPRGKDAKTYIFETQGAEITKDALTTIVNSLQEVSI